MNTRLHEAHFGMPNYSEAEKQAIQSLYESKRPAFPRGSWKGREEERKVKNFNPVTQAALSESYMRKNAKICDIVPARQSQELWEIIKTTIKLEFSQPSYETWIEPLVAVGYHLNCLYVAASSDFNQEQIVKRYRKRLRELTSELTDNTLGFEVIVDESLQTEPKQQHPTLRVINPNYPGKNAWGMQQNPTNNHKINYLLNRYQDMRGIFLKDKDCKKIWASRAKGGWGVNFGKLIKVGKEHGLERVLWALNKMDELEDLAINPGGMFLSLAETGRERK